MTKKVLVTGDSVRSDVLQPFREEGWSVANPTHLLSEGELQEELSDADAYLLGGDEFASRTALSSAKKLKLISFLGMGYERYVDSDAAKELDIVVTNTPGTLSNAVAELTINHLLCAVRKTYYYATLFAAGRHGLEEKQRDLAALHHGIVGLGGIGTRVAEILRNGFQARVSYFSRTRKPDLESSLNMDYHELDELVRLVDSLIVLTPSNPETTGLIGTSEFAACKPGLVVVNTSSPPIVDPEALNAAIDQKQVSYAAFDAFYEDSESVAALLKKIPEHLMVTAHIGSLTDDARDAMGILAVKSIVSMLKNGLPLHRVV